MLGKKVIHIFYSDPSPTKFGYGIIIDMKVEWGRYYCLVDWGEEGKTWHGENYLRILI